MLKVTQRSGGANRKFYVTNPLKAKFWRMMSKEHAWTKDESGKYYGVKVQKV